MKRILFTEPNVAKLMDGEITPPKENQVVVQLAVSTISSGTERALLTGDPNIDSKKEASVIFPRASGYSSAGTVVQVGENVTTVQPGDRVALSWSSHSQFVTLAEKNVYKIHDIPFTEAALWHIATFPTAAIRKCRLEIGESAMVMGQGVLGQMAVKLLRAAGAVPIIAVDPMPQKRERALMLGADYALDPFDPDFAKTAKELTDGGVNVCIEVTGNGKGLDGALDCMAAFGRVALLGCTRDTDFTIDYYRKVHGPGITLIGAHTNARPKTESQPGVWTHRDDVFAIKKLYQLGRLRFVDMVEETYSPVQAPEVYSRLAAGGAFPLVQFDWSKL